MGFLRRVRGGAGAGRGYNSHYIPPKPSETHTVRDDSGNSTQAMTQRRADRDAASASGPHSGYVNPDGSDAMGPKKPNIKIGAEYTTYHEPDSPEGSAILKDKKKTAKALKKVNSPKVMGEARAAAVSFEVAKKEETSRTKNNKMLGIGENHSFSEKPSGSEAAYLEGGAKAEQAYRKAQNRKRMGG